MNNTTLSSTFFLTLLLVVGLFFFIRGSTKDRIEEIEFFSLDSPENALELIQSHLENRAYSLSKVEPEVQQMIFDGKVQPSWFLAIFLTVLTAIGLSSLGLVLSFLLPEFKPFFLGLNLLSPLSGFFYWKGAQRIENVTVRVLSNQNISVIGHRDELSLLKNGLPSLNTRAL